MKYSHNLCSQHILFEFVKIRLNVLHYNKLVDHLNDNLKDGFLCVATCISSFGITFNFKVRATHVVHASHLQTVSNAENKQCVMFQYSQC